MAAGILQENVVICSAVGLFVGFAGLCAALQLMIQVAEVVHFDFRLELLELQFKFLVSFLELLRTRVMDVRHHAVF